MISLQASPAMEINITHSLKCHYTPTVTHLRHSTQKIELLLTPFFKNHMGTLQNSNMILAHLTLHDLCLSRIYSQTHLFHPLLPFPHLLQ